MEKIDFVVTWVDGNDPIWQTKKAHYQTKNPLLNSEARYRNWQFLHYWFRSVEKNAPWVNRIFLITEGHLPSWLNTAHPKLVHVRHEDYIPAEYLPTYNSNVIELHIHRIKELSSQFVLFNDDMFLNRQMQPTDFFSAGKPRDFGIFSPLVPQANSLDTVILKMNQLINQHFSKKSILKGHFSQYFNLKYGRQLMKNFCVLPWQGVLGFYDPHLPVAYLKSTFEDVWQIEQAELERISQHRFRESDDISHWLMRYWQLASGNFEPQPISVGKNYLIGELPIDIEREINQGKHSLVCLNDNDFLKNFNRAKEMILTAFDNRYPEKSAFEK
ncbi:Stealth CR1 domain-containing protein [Enterococcus sp. AZ103]|uniref:Stealth CR1 domain-containing protein n=1 Tax=Enterococcus sp. AZ103 TaxID=2774628 RepID=UPI003F268ABB